MTFCQTVNAGSRLNDWKTKPIRSRRSSVSLRSLSPASAWPSMETLPDVGRSSPAAQCRKVLLPDPDGPITAVKVPGANFIEIPSRAVTAFPPRP